MRALIKLLKMGALLFAASVVTLLAVRAYDSQRGAPLAPWHTYAPHELTAQELAKTSWDDYLAAERKIFESVRANVTQKLDPEDQVPANRYFEGSPIYPGHFATDWNRSYILEPEGTPVGAVVFLHGLTDSPYSLRHVARLYQSHGFVSVAIRLPGHGTHWRDMMRSRYADWRDEVRRARERLRGAGKKVLLVGLSLGGSLALDVASEQPEAVAGVVCINATVLDREGILAKLAPVLEKILPVVPAKAAGLVECSNQCFTGTCSHSECVTGEALGGQKGVGCSTCSGAVCAQDKSCCETSWGGNCVAIAQKQAVCTCN